MIGTEHEYSINDDNFCPLPISDRLIERVAGNVSDEIPFGGVRLSKELQKHVLELVPPPQASLSELELLLQAGVDRMHRCFGDMHFLGLGMHPLLTLDQTTWWDHDEGEYYDAYNRLFNLRQHGWLNIQALQINFPYGDNSGLVQMFNRVRSLIPYLVAVSASSPFVEGRATGYADNRLIYYRDNQKEIPQICNDILPERLSSHRDWVRINRSIYRELKAKKADVLCREWVNSRGAIVRFTRGCIEVKALDEQECIRSDMAMTAFLLALLKSPLPLEDDEAALRALLKTAISSGTDRLQPELQRLCDEAERRASPDQMAYLPVVRQRIEGGSLSQILVERYRDSGDMRVVLAEADRALRQNIPMLNRS